MTAGAESRTIIQVVDGDVEVARWRMPRQLRADLALVDALARLQLAAKRHGLSVRLRETSPQLRGLLGLVGLADLLGLEPVGETEGGEEIGVDEVVQARDPSV